MRTPPALLATIVIIASAIVAFAVIRPFEDDGEPRPVHVSVDAIVTTPPQWYRMAVEVTTRAVPLDDERFLLDGDERAIVVRPRPDAVDGEVESGERVTVRGVVYWLDRSQASELRRILRADGRSLLAQAPISLGDPYIFADYVNATA